jgi:hypothetical protein
MAAPAGVFFNGDFTVSFWAKFHDPATSTFPKIIDFGLATRFVKLLFSNNSNNFIKISYI